MTDLRTAAQQALKILELEGWGYPSPKTAAAITALRAALAEPVQEPVAWIQPDHLQKARKAPFLCRVEPTKRMVDFVALYTAPPHRPAEPVQEPQCNPHPKAPHGFLRNASHNEDRYVCECEGWEPYEAGYQAGMEAALRAQS